MRSWVVFAVPLLALAACTPAETDDEVTPVDIEEPDAETETVLDLEATGINIPPQNGSDEQFAAPFGSNRAATEITLGNLLGEGTPGSDGYGDCWLQTTDYPGLSLSFNDEDEFVGYYARAPYVPELSRAEMLADPAVELFEDSTLGEEFTIGDADGPMISGMFSGEGDDAAVESLWAGENCIFR